MTLARLVRVRDSFSDVAAAAERGTASVDGHAAVAGSVMAERSFAVAGSAMTRESAAVAGSAATTRSAAVAGSAATSCSTAVAGSTLTVGSAAVAGSAGTALSVAVDGERAAERRFRGDVRTHESVRGAGEPPVRDQRDIIAESCADDGTRLRQHLSHPRAADGSLEANDDDLTGPNCSIAHCGER